MSDAKVTVVAKLKARPGLEDEVNKTLMALVAPTRTEDGCINYDLHQSQDDPSQFLFHENWVSREALDCHLAKPYLQGLMARADQLFAEPIDVMFWTEISENRIASKGE